MALQRRRVAHWRRISLDVQDDELELVKTSHVSSSPTPCSTTAAARERTLVFLTAAARSTAGGIRIRARRSTSDASTVASTRPSHRTSVPGSCGVVRLAPAAERLIEHDERCLTCAGRLPSPDPIGPLSGDALLDAVTEAVVALHLRYHTAHRPRPRLGCSTTTSLPAGWI
jgi:hypothetical protein